MIFGSYTLLIAEKTASDKKKYNSRFKQLIDWCRPNYDGAIIFDESHKARGTEVGKAVLDLQSKLPDARVVCALATGKIIENIN